ncbi:hypothetical protein CEXT_117231, partial [Caerostris extrusa]
MYYCAQKVTPLNNNDSPHFLVIEYQILKEFSREGTQKVCNGHQHRHHSHCLTWLFDYGTTKPLAIPLIVQEM